MTARAMRAALSVALAAGSLAVAVLVPGGPATAADDCLPDAGYTACTRLTYSGADQSYVVPAGVVSLSVKAWGAGGGGVDLNYYPQEGGGGGGGLTSATVAVTPGQTLAVVVGQGGRSGVNGSTRPTYGGGGAGGDQVRNSPSGDGSSGGGLSGVFAGAVTPAAALLIAGGGGGGSPGANGERPVAGGGGGAAGGAGGPVSVSGRGGTATAGGTGASSATGCATPATAGTALQGGQGASITVVRVPISEGGGGGGGGWYGGGGGTCQTVAQSPNGTGGGGSAYLGPTATGTTTAGGNAVYGVPGTGGAPAGGADPQYVVGVGTGGTVVAGGSDGGNGMVVIQWNRTYTVSAAATSTRSTAGDSVTYTLTLTNPSVNNYTVDAPAGFVADLSGVLDDATWNNDPVAAVTGWDFGLQGATFAGIGPLAAGATITITFSVLVKEAGLGDDSLVATVVAASAGGACVVGQCALTTPGPVLVLQKTATPSVVTAPQPVVFTFRVTNYGTVTLTDLNIQDDLSAPAGPPLSFVCPSITLAPGASTTCAGTYLVTAIDITARGVYGTAFATASSPAGDEDVASNYSSAPVLGPSASRSPLPR